MVRPNGVTCAVAIGLVAWSLAPANADPITIGSWQVDSSVDTMTDERRITAANPGRDTAEDGDPMPLGLFCFDGMLAVSLHTRGFWLKSSLLLPVMWRVDAKPAVRDSWFLLPSGKMAHSNENRPLLAALRTGSEARFRVESSDRSYESTFDLAGSEQVIASMRKYCDSKAKRPPRPPAKRP
jgi:hypothetical protein